MMLYRLVVVCFLFATLAPKAEDVTQLTPADCSLNVGWSIWPPYQYFSESGKPIGLQIELLKQIATEANCTFNFVQQSFSQNVSDIRDGKLDMMPDITVTDKRRLFAYFSEPYRHEIQILYVKSEFFERCKDQSLETILSRDFRLGLSKSNFYGEKLESIKNDLTFKDNLVFLDKNSQGIAAIVSGKIDGYFEDPAVIAYLTESEKLTVKIKSCYVENYAGKLSLMFSKKSTDKQLVKRINRAIKEVKESKLYKRHWEW